MRNTPLLAVLVSAVLAGCPRAGVPTPRGAQPEVSVADVSVGRLGMDQVELIVGLRIDNPYPVALPLRQIDWTLELADARLLRGQAPGTDVPAGGEARLEVPILVRWQEVLPALLGVGRTRDLPWTLHGTAALGTPIGELGIPFRRSGQLRIQLPAHVAQLHPPS